MKIENMKQSKSNWTIFMIPEIVFGKSGGTFKIWLCWLWWVIEISF